MTRRARNRIRYGLVLLLLCAVTAGQTAALTSAHERHQAHDHGCLVCYVGSLPLVECTTEAPAAPVFLVRWLVSPPEFSASHDARPATRSSRAPPA
jgi:hypothetical protein